MWKKKKPIERICGNCKLFQPNNRQCSVVILHQGTRLHIPVDPEDACFFEDPHFDPITNDVTDFVDEIKEVKFWVEDETGQKTDKNGTVKIEYPEGFFGKDELFAVPDEPEEIVPPPPKSLTEPNLPEE